MIKLFHSLHYSTVDIRLRFGEIYCFSCMVDYQTEMRYIAEDGVFMVIIKTFKRHTMKETKT